MALQRRKADGYRLLLRPRPELGNRRSGVERGWCGAVPLHVVRIRHCGAAHCLEAEVAHCLEAHCLEAEVAHGGAFRGGGGRSGAAPCCRADEIINSSAEDVAARVKEITGGEGAYSGLDPVAGTGTGTVTSANGQPPAHFLPPPNTQHT